MCDGLQHPYYGERELKKIYVWWVLLENRTGEICKALQQPMVLNGIVSSDFGMDWFINGESMTCVDGKYSITSFIFLNILISF
jgi:hypothetical protein